MTTKNATTTTLTIRLPQPHFDALAKEAEASSGSIAQRLREIISDYLSDRAQADRLDGIESRLSRKIGDPFEKIKATLDRIEAALSALEVEP